MENNSIACAVVMALTFWGCVSAERMAEYSAWQKSDDGVANVQLEEFESKYQNGWRERAETKKAQRLEFEAWKASDDAVANASMEDFVSKYQNGWRERAQTKKTERLVREAKEAAERERVAKERAAAERARLAKEAAERAEKRRLAMRTELYEKTIGHNLAKIRKCYSYGSRYENPFLHDQRHDRACKSDWLSKWTSPRLGITEADAQAGEALLSDFGTKYLPNAYANYEKKREVVAELQQVFNEEFPLPWTIKARNPKWNSFNKVLEKFVKARTEFFFCHDELCHYWLLSRFGVLTDKDFAQIDANPLAVNMLPENIERAGYTLLKMNSMESKIADFAVKYAPESNSIYQKMMREFKELDALLSDVLKQRIQMDDVRYSRVIAAAVAKRNDLVRKVNALAYQLQAWHMDHRTMEKSSEDVVKCDAAMSKRLKPFVDALPTYIKEEMARTISKSEMIAIPGRRYHMQRTEVTQLQWMLVMGNNPSKFRCPDRPVENVSWDDCQEFIKKLNELDGTNYRLPTEEEWEYACRAGSKGDWGMRANGEEGLLDVMGWYNGNSWDKTHPVAQKEPNAWGLFDMHGNVGEWCGCSKENVVLCGGCWLNREQNCAASFRYSRRSRSADSLGQFGLRLAASQD